MERRRRLVILGSTGSIGRQALEVVEQTGEFEVVGVGARRNASALAEQVRRFRPEVVALDDPQAAAELRSELPSGVQLLSGPHALEALAAWGEADVVLVAVVGAAGLLPTLAALRAGRDVALATKEVLVAAGAVVMGEARARGRRVLPVDSEHVAIAQCLRGESPDAVRRILLTASGGPFLRWPREALAAARPDDALAHPTWRMGPKITVDSATLMNKGLEVIEAHHLFGVPPERIEVVIHPQSIVHSLVEFVDGSVKAQLAPPDMRPVIAYALRGGDRRPLPAPSVDWDRLTLTFERPDPARYPCLGYAYEALAAGGTMPAVLNASNEVAVELFLQGRIRFLDIPAIVRRTLDAHRPVSSPTVEEILAADAWARTYARGDPARAGPGPARAGDP
ncbi:MAG: 1-deoxy-D-xylulose-5-phosphate reductoisomerase [Armatimonadota bacterium]|nr:1-deoxy-D-xylulose-5-phosphate reductoisomerase [Armatimonadota bacterium]MDR7402764.1 1-deoxy-D-xylulose-5-phosphate reductoisomerase [Armatimonadota bacterium]MDR7404032.1 1-deoxy-D-xylulose-5-phosphate reductoisomerase [Armatimonadota bacterium]MDR7437025.1 1-deoxy-D-xylulose-5-phosphate reductoisomerase [Armatimonadota bacterium]MDR7472904.1 1-deoxy-D-xylulose-5-phosphate reductoisomerase [Armatimonadota bacterium]